jgi:serine/threonine protein kinase
MPDQLKTLPSLFQPRAGDFDVGACLSDDEILAFVQGELPTDTIESMHVHVDQCDVCQRLLAEATRAIDVDPEPQSGRVCWNTVFQSNALVGKRYRIMRLVARGGMGEVYEAFDTTLRERVALKTVASTACDSVRAVQHLKAEVQLARRITHPNVCRIFDFGTHVMEPVGAEINFLVMELVEGECLGKRLRRTGALPLNLAQAIARQLLLGLNAAHQAGILHRDFKSENVILRTDRNGVVNAVILDFGLAKALNESGNLVTTQDPSQAMVGTFGYMAPEQIEGQPLTRASDIYALGVVWFEMLTGRLPFEGGSPAASAIARLHRDAEPPSSVNPDVPEWLDDIILRCLSRKPKSRYAGAQQVLEALSTATAEPTQEVPSGLASHEHRWSVAALALVLTMLGYGVLQRQPRSGVAAKAWQVVPSVSIWPEPQLKRIKDELRVNPRQTAINARRTTATIGKDKAAQNRPVASRPAPSQPAPPVSTNEAAAPATTAEIKKPSPWLPLWPNRAKSEQQPVVN